MFSKNLIRLSLITVVAFSVCSAPTNDTGATAVTQLELTSADVPGWSSLTTGSMPDTFLAYPIESLDCCVPGSIDGGAVWYDTTGCTKVAYQTMTRPLTAPDTARSASYVMDFGTSAKATAMFQKNNDGTQSAVPSFSTSAAMVKIFPTTIKTIAHFNKFYIELVLTGFYSTSTQRVDTVPALAAAGLFLTAYRNKIE